MEKDIAQLLLPAGMLDHFEVVSVSREVDRKDKYPVLKIHLEEKNNPPSGYAPGELESKGFYQAKQVQDFPIRGKRVFLSIKRRRWRLISDKNQCVSNDYSYLTEGTKMTRELSDFLKGTGGNPR
jgi:hypothetical protein